MHLAIGGRKGLPFFCTILLLALLLLLESELDLVVDLRAAG
jgi:hypothetical protein